MKFFKLLLVSYFLFQFCYGYELCRQFPTIRFEQKLLLTGNVINCKILKTITITLVYMLLSYIDKQTTTALPTIRVFQTNPAAHQVFHDSQTPTTITTTLSQSNRGFKLTTFAPKVNQDFQTTAKSDLFILEKARNTLPSPITPTSPTRPEPDQLSKNVPVLKSTIDPFSHVTTLQTEMTVFHTNSNTGTTTIPKNEVKNYYTTQQHILATNSTPASNTASKTHYMTMPVHATVIIQDHNRSSDTPFIFITANLSGPSSSHTKQPPNDLTTSPLSMKSSENVPLSDETTDAVSNPSLVNANVTKYSTLETTISAFHSTHDPTNSLEDQLPSHSDIENALPKTLPTEAISHDDTWKTEDYVVAIAVPLLVIGIILMWMLLISFYKRKPLCNFAWFNSSNHHRHFPREDFELREWVYADQGNLTENLTENTTSFIQREAESSYVMNLTPSPLKEQYWDIPL